MNENNNASSCGCSVSQPAATGMLVSELKAALAAAPTLPLTVVWTDGEPIEPHFHVTEVGRVQKDFVDCGGTVRRLVTCLLQTWVGDDLDHRITAGKLLKAFEHAAPVLGGEDLPVELEYEACNVVQLVVASVKAEPDRLILQLGPKHTDCLAKELCVPSANGAAKCC
ncbi:hypothetical protein ASA1KI_22780 [Opitutales bacterium ASA1]|uniref:DUF6428 family protein n=1 Tax=Congregicoccus parvus TaxID=3081749 RepID=UPI002B2D6158|nr:hypothetical protein ASA1KI_22780 [Opitutales bacterium ASA1]